MDKRSREQDCPLRPHRAAGQGSAWEAALQGLLSDVGEAAAPLDLFAQAHHPNPNFLSLGQGEDAGRKLSVKA